MTKTNTRSRIVSILLVLMMLLTMVPITAVTANAADGFVEVSTYEQLKPQSIRVMLRSSSWQTSTPPMITAVPV